MKAAWGHHFPCEHMQHLSLIYVAADIHGIENWCNICLPSLRTAWQHLEPQVIQQKRLTTVQSLSNTTSNDRCLLAMMIVAFQRVELEVIYCYIPVVWHSPAITSKTLCISQMSNCSKTVSIYLLCCIAVYLTKSSRSAMNCAIFKCWKVATTKRNTISPYNTVSSS